jgi:hypothetical protein
MKTGLLIIFLALAFDTASATEFPESRVPRGSGLQISNLSCDLGHGQSDSGTVIESSLILSSPLTSVHRVC